jgi:putative addiction module CopG family antidote
MNITLQPSARQFIDDQVKAGRFASPDAVIDAAIAEMRELQAASELDDEAIAAISEAEAQADRGEGVDLDAFRSQFQGRRSPR